MITKFKIFEQNSDDVFFIDSKYILRKFNLDQYEIVDLKVGDSFNAIRDNYILFAWKEHMWIKSNSPYVIDLVEDKQKACEIEGFDRFYKSEAELPPKTNEYLYRLSGFWPWFKIFKKIPKTIISKLDPYGEEDWDFDVN